MIKIKSKHNIAVFQAILTAALYAISSPISKLRYDTDERLASHHRIHTSISR